MFTANLSTARHQQTNGQAEIAVRTYKRSAKKFASVTNLDWDDKLALLEFALNNSISASTGFTPFYLAFGFNPRTLPEEYVIQNRINSSTSDAHQLLADLSQNLSLAQESIQAAQELQRTQYNLRHDSSPSYTIGDVVLLSSEGINWPSFANSPSASIPPYLGPFKITHIDSARDNITLEFPSFLQSSRFHPTFHVSRLRPFVQRTDSFPGWRDSHARPAPIAVNEAGQDLFEVDRILSKRTFNRKTQYLLGFRGYPDSHNEWYTFDPQNRHDWQSEWTLLFAFDPSVGRYEPAITSSSRRRNPRRG